MPDYMNINEFIKNYDNQNNDFNYNDNDIYYNDFISNYDEFTELN